MTAAMDKIKNNGIRSNLIVGVTAVAAITLIIYIIYGAVYDYFDIGVFFIMLAALVLYGASAAMATMDKAPKTSLAALVLGNICFAWALGFFFLNSYPVWADEVNGITMYNSRGGLFPVITIILLFFICIITGSVAAFKEKKNKEAE